MRTRIAILVASLVVTVLVIPATQGKWQKSLWIKGYVEVAEPVAETAVMDELLLVEGNPTDDPVQSVANGVELEEPALEEDIEPGQEVMNGVDSEGSCEGNVVEQTVEEVEEQAEDRTEGSPDISDDSSTEEPTEEPADNSYDEQRVEPARETETEL